ncbi:DUF1405 domain-containing protein [Desmospora activa]|uniref:Putative membrane protein YpjA n=1 Tax=Desmospora activa DSM 45169 TaxID=1121389 RepID=A0A2T4Z9Z5_9BACL|nr:DUF1405 domain-containing protein [Desmospora activa]PTM58707.1 putative membrane protein YpjA [Desmospora activa DSM 45169]
MWKWCWQTFLSWLDHRWFLWLLFIINFLGTIYGFYWYKNQLVSIGSWLNLFVPDSPTASAAFTLVLLVYLIKRRSPLLEAFAAVTLFKYGIWAVAMIFAGAWLNEPPLLEALRWTDWMLTISHLGMAWQAILYSRFFTFGIRELSLVAAWTLLNDCLDYGLGIHPWLQVSLYDHLAAVAAFTVGLSFVSLALFTWLVLPPRPERKWELPSLMERQTEK